MPNRATVSLAKAGNTFYGSIPFWVLMALPLMALGIAFKRRQDLIAHSLIDRSVLKKQKAAQEAQKRLVLAKQHLDNQESKAFYNEISHALWGYLGDKMSIPAADLSKKIIRERLSNLPDGESHADRVEAMIQTCEMALYASMDNADAMLHTYDDASSVIEDIENRPIVNTLYQKKNSLDNVVKKLKHKLENGPEQDYYRRRENEVLRLEEITQTNNAVFQVIYIIIKVLKIFLKNINK